MCISHLEGKRPLCYQSAGPETAAMMSDEEGPVPGAQLPELNIIYRSFKIRLTCRMQRKAKSKADMLI